MSEKKSFGGYIEDVTELGRGAHDMGQNQLLEATGKPPVVTKE